MCSQGLDIAATVLQRTGGSSKSLMSRRDPCFPDEIEVASGAGGEGIHGRYCATDVVEIGASLDAEVVAADASAEVVDVLGGERYGLSSGDGAAVEQGACDIEVDVVTGHQSTARLQIAFPDMYVELWYHAKKRGPKKRGHKKRGHKKRGQIYFINSHHRHFSPSLTHF